MNKTLLITLAVDQEELDKDVESFDLEDVTNLLYEGSDLLDWIDNHIISYEVRSDE